MKFHRGKEREVEYELSEEAKISPEQLKYTKDLGKGRMVISTEPIAEEEPNMGKLKSSEKELRGVSEIQPELEVEKRKEQISEKTFNLDPLKLVRILSSYGVPLDSTVRELIIEIKKKGKDHLEKELKQI
jgi:hypothetical protein